MQVLDLNELVQERLCKARNEKGLDMSDKEVFNFAVEWENICNKLNSKRSKKLC